MLQDILITGLVNGGVYALLAMGFSLIFGVARIVNVAHCAFYMLAAYCLYTLLTYTGMGMWLAALASVAAVTALSLICYRLFIEPVRQHESAVLIATIALGLIFQELMLRVFGGHYLGIPNALEGVVTLLGVTIPYQRLLILVIAGASLAAVWFVLHRTRLGLAIRATANDLEVANLMGMDVRTVAMATMAISVALAVVVLGGLGSLKGSLIGALIIGYVEAITVFLLPQCAFLKGAVALSIMVVVLLARPEGLYGVAFEEER